MIKKSKTNSILKNKGLKNFSLFVKRNHNQSIRYRNDNSLTLSTKIAFNIIGSKWENSHPDDMTVIGESDRTLKQNPSFSKELARHLSNNTTLKHENSKILIYFQNWVVKSMNQDLDIHETNTENDSEIVNIAQGNEILM